MTDILLCVEGKGKLLCDDEILLRPCRLRTAAGLDKVPVGRNLGPTANLGIAGYNPYLASIYVSPYGNSLPLASI